jgi:uncharacterized RDD family membrane protein YckC
MPDAAVMCTSCGHALIAPGGMSAAATSDRASFGQRLLSWIIDTIIVAVVSGVIGAIVGDGGNFIGFLLGLGYFVYFEGSPSGQTVGKRAMGIRVVTEAGGPLGHGLATGRYFARWLSAIPCALGYFWMLWDDQKQTWHDKLVHSYVVTVDAHPVASWPG